MAGNDHPLPRPDLGLFQSLINGDPGAQDGRCGTKLQLRREMPDIGRIGQCVFGKGAIDGISRIDLRLAERFPTRPAVLASAAGRMQPRNADPVALFDATHAWPKGSHVTDTFVTRNKGRLWFHWPVSLGGMQIGVADASRLDANEDFASPRFGNWHLLEHKRFPEALNDSRLHHFRHFHLSSKKEPLCT